MIESDYEQDIEEVTEEVDDNDYDDDDDDDVKSFIPIKDVNIADDLQIEDDDSRADPIINHQIENDQETEDEEGCILLSDVILQDNDDDDDDDDVDDSDQELAEYEWTALNSIDYEDDDDDYSETCEEKNAFQTSLGSIGKSHGNRHKTDAAEKSKPKLEKNKSVQFKEIGDQASRTSRGLMLSEVPSRQVTVSDDSEQVIGELVPPADLRFWPADRVPRSKCFYKCAHCEHKARSRHKLRLHYRKHSREKPFSCQVCGKQFRQNHHVTDHLRIHTGERPFKCSMCEKSFTRSHHLKRHCIGHHNIEIDRK